MARGFLSGIFWGGVLGVGVSGAASVMTPLPNPPQVSDAAPDAAALSALPQEDGVQGGSDTDPAVATQSVAQQVEAPNEDSLEAVDNASLSAPDQPLTGASDSALQAPDAPIEEGAVDVASDAPVLPTPQALAPMAPQAADTLSIDTTPAEAPLIVIEPEPGEIETAEAQPEIPIEAPQENVETATATPDTPDEEPAETVSEVVIEPVPVPDAVTEETAEAPTETPDEAPTDAAPEDAAEGTENNQQIAGLRPSIGEPAGTLTDRNTGVTIRRPSSAPLAQVDGSDTEAEVVTEVAAVAPDADPRPIAQFAQAFEDPGDKPLMSIVLIDDGSSAVAGTAGIAALRNFPYPLSFAVDARLPDAEERMTIYRNEGFEVLAMVNLPAGAVASDAETTFGAVFPQLAEIVGVLEGTDGGLQPSREVADQVTSILQQTGHGLLTQDKGLNTMPKLARKEGVPAAPIFRDFDSKDQSAAIIRRFLDQAAFKAGQEGGVVMLGRLRPDTISALLLWGLQDRAGKVALVPVSGVLLREQ